MKTMTDKNNLASWNYRIVKCEHKIDSISFRWWHNTDMMQIQNIFSNFHYNFNEFFIFLETKFFLSIVWSYRSLPLYRFRFLNAWVGLRYDCWIVGLFPLVPRSSSLLHVAGSHWSSALVLRGSACFSYQNQERKTKTVLKIKTKKQQRSH